MVVAPMTEEALKNYFIQMKMPWMGVSIVIGLEADMYLTNMIRKGYNIPMAVLARVVALAIHFSTTFIQKKIIESGEDKYGDSDRAFIAWMVGVAIHASWNTFVTLS